MLLGKAIEMETMEMAVTAARRYVERCGHEVLEECYEAKDGRFDLVFFDDDPKCLVFAIVKANGLGSADEVDLERFRPTFEQTAFSYLSEHCEDLEGDFRVRLDVFHLTFLGSDRMFLKHHINALA